MEIPEEFPNLRDKARLRREAATVAAMIDIYCGERHGTAVNEVCAECAELRDYSFLRLNQCPFQEGKTTCGNCRVHCYKPAMRSKAKEMMSVAGPRMVYRHPLMTARHFIDGWRRRPQERQRPHN
jgi:hypothetical protein